MPVSKSSSKTPGTLKEVLQSNVRRQQRRSTAAASPPEAQRPVRERVRTAERKRKASTGRAASARKPH